MRRLLVGVAVVAAAATVATANAGVGATRATVTKIVFSGSAAHPVVTIVGSHFGTAPIANPSYTPGGHPGCPNDFAGPEGHDYGTRLYLADTSDSPQWSGGRWRPSLPELDCVGLLIDRWSPGLVRFHFGSFYRIGHFSLDPGDSVEIGVNHLVLGVAVKYGPSGVKP